MILESLKVALGEFEARTGWVSKPEGFCKGGQCVPASDAVSTGGLVHIDKLAPKLRMPLVSDDEHEIQALGPESGGQALTTAQVPEIVLPDIDGNPFSLSSLHGRKVLLVAWASW